MYVQLYRAVFMQHNFSVHVSFTAAMLVYCNVQYSMGKKHFQCRYGEMQATNRPLFAYYNTIIQIIACTTYANDGQIATCTCVAP